MTRQRRNLIGGSRQRRGLGIITQGLSDIKELARAPQAGVIENTRVLSTGGAGAVAMAEHGNDYHDPDYTPQTTFDDHGDRHENGGADEISVAGLSGELADDQPPKEHGPSKHTVAVDTRVVCFTVDGGGSEIPDNTQCDIPWPPDLGTGAAVAYRLLADQSGSIVIDMWCDVEGNYPPTVADSMPGAGKEPTLSAAAYAEDDDLSDWANTSVTAGSTFRINVVSCTTITRFSLALVVRQS